LFNSKNRSASSFPYLNVFALSVCTGRVGQPPEAMLTWNVGRAWAVVPTIAKRKVRTAALIAGANIAVSLWLDFKDNTSAGCPTLGFSSVGCDAAEITAMCSL
jgi:hypothetical protein